MRDLDPQRISDHSPYNHRLNDNKRYPKGICDDTFYLGLVGHAVNQCNRRRGFTEPDEMIKGNFFFVVVVVIL